MNNVTPPSARTAAPVSADAEAKITKELEPGDYVVSIRDLTWSGGPGYAYRLFASPLGGLPPDFAVRFLPDAPRLHRGGNAKFWCEVERTAGYKGEVTVTLEGLPAGVTAAARHARRIDQRHLHHLRRRRRGPGTRPDQAQGDRRARLAAGRPLRDARIERPHRCSRRT